MIEMVWRVVERSHLYPVTVEEARELLAAGDGVSDAEIQHALAAAVDYAERYMMRPVMAQRIDATCNASLQSWTLLEYAAEDAEPVVTDCKAWTSDAAYLSVAPADIEAVPHLNRWAVRIKPSAISATPALASAIKSNISYRSGAADHSKVPPQIVRGIMVIVGHWINNSKLVEAGVRMTSVPRAADQLLSAYRVVAV